MSEKYICFLHTSDPEEYGFIAVINWDGPISQIEVQNRRSSRGITQSIQLDDIPIRSFFTLTYHRTGGVITWSAQPTTPDDLLKLKQMSGVLDKMRQTIIMVNEMMCWDLEEEIGDVADIIDQYVFETRDSILRKLV